jgi:DNA-binding PadR family transcriptional regulator
LTHNAYSVYISGMSIRNGILALLVEASRHGYQVKTDFEERTGGTWPLNIGQVYTTLARLERDGLVTVVDGTDQSGTAAPGDASRIVYAATDAGRAVVREWFSTPVHRTQAPRDELAIKLALAVRAPGVHVASLVQAQRTEAVRSLQELTRLKANSSIDDSDLAWLLVVDSMVFQAEAEVRWLDHCEARLVRAAGARPASHPLDHPSAHPASTVTESAR